MANPDAICLKPYHQVWLDAHPSRDEAWLRNVLSLGFNIHHVDLDHANCDPKNLVLIEFYDHMMLHRGSHPMPRGFLRKRAKKAQKAVQRPNPVKLTKHETAAWKQRAKDTYLKTQTDLACSIRAVSANGRS